MSAAETTTQVLHRLTSYESGRAWTDPVADSRIVQGLEVNDVARTPWPYKRYVDKLRRRALPLELPPTTAPALAVLAGTARPAATSSGIATLARLLFLSAGVVRTAEREGRRLLFRASGSAGGRFPLELYVAVPDGGSFPAGVHWYDPERHWLVEVGPPPAGEATALVVTGVPWRTGWRYRERGYRHLYWDAGTMLAQLLVLASSAGLDADLISRFPDATLDALVGADGVHEFTLAVVSLGCSRPALAPSGAATMGGVDSAPLEFPLVSAAQRAGRLDRWGEPWPRGEPTEAPDHGPTIDQVIRRRSSQRRMDATRGLPRPVLETCMQVASRGVHVPHWVVVHDVNGMSPGVYRWPDLARPVRVGLLRKELYRICLDQGLARDAAFVVVSAIRTADLDDRAYRDAQLAAGLVAGRLHLAAYAQEAGASGMTFLDSELPALLREPVDGLLFTCVGVPDNTSKPGGLPRKPTTIRPVPPRLDDE